MILHTTQPPILKPLGLSNGGQHQHSTSSPSTFHISSDSLAVRGRPQQTSSSPSGDGVAAEDLSFCCESDEYGDLRSNSRSRGQPRDVRKKSKSSQIQYLSKQAFASRGAELEKAEVTREVDDSTVSRPRKREDRRREDLLAASSLALTGSGTANESRKTTTRGSNLDPYWPSPLRGNDPATIAAAGNYDTRNYQQQQQQRQGRGRKWRKEPDT